MKNVIIIGTGGSSKVIYNSIKTYKKLNILGFLDDDKGNIEREKELLLMQKRV